MAESLRESPTILSAKEIKELRQYANELLDVHSRLAHESGAAHCLCEEAQKYREADEKHWREYRRRRITLLSMVECPTCLGTGKVLNG